MLVYEVPPRPLATTSPFPLAVHASGRYLVDVHGAPWRHQGDAAWFIHNHLASTTDQDTYLTNVKAAGFNSIIMMSLVNNSDGTGWPSVNEPSDANGNAPFTTAGWLDTPNDTYFNACSRVISKALSLNIGVQLFPLYLGYLGGAQGWEFALNDAHNTNTVCFNFGVYCAQKFPQSNVMWMWMGDRTASGTPLARFQQFVAGVQSITRNRLAGSELAHTTNGTDGTLVTDQTGFTYGASPASYDMNVNSFYPDPSGLSHLTADRAWVNSPTLPCIEQEPVYEHATYNTQNGRSHIRASMHWAVTAGSTAGTNSGFHASWTMVRVGDETRVTPNRNWTQSFTGTARADATYAFALYQSVSWWLHAPSGTGTGYCGRLLIVSGIGSGATKITSSMASDGSSLLAYVPPTGTGTTTFSVDLRSMSGTKTAYWWNPTTGGYTTIGSFANSLSAQSFTTPSGDNGGREDDASNGLGINDWMLVIK